VAGHEGAAEVDRRGVAAEQALEGDAGLDARHARHQRVLSAGAHAGHEGLDDALGRVVHGVEAALDGGEEALELAPQQPLDERVLAAEAAEHGDAGHARAPPHVLHRRPGGAVGGELGQGGVEDAVVGIARRRRRCAFAQRPRQQVVERDGHAACATSRAAAKSPRAIALRRARK